MSSAKALSLESLAYSSWMVNTRTESSSAEAFSSMGLDFFLDDATLELEPERGAGGMALVGLPGRGMIWRGSGMTYGKKAGGR